jgi:hypothetical protein
MIAIIGPVGPKKPLSLRTGPGALWAAVGVRVSVGKMTFIRANHAYLPL